MTGDEVMSPRCVVRGCPVRFKAGLDRPCPMHQHDAEAMSGSAIDQGKSVFRRDDEPAPGKRR